MGRSAGEAGGPSGDGGAAAQVAAAAQAAAARVAVAAAAAQAGDPAFGGYARQGAADWAEAWREREKLRKAPDEAAIWDARAQEFSRQSRHSDYAAGFLARLDLAPGLTVLDMGAGSGALALPLAAAGHQVIAADISSGMLAELQKQAAATGLSDRIRCVKLDFNAPFADWQAVGLTEGCVDVALASRSAMVRDLAACLAKLEAVARQRVAVTMVTEYGPRGYKRMGDLDNAGNTDGGLGSQAYVPDFIYTINILLAQGRYPELTYLDSYKPDEQADGAGGQRLIRWAFISWEVDWEGAQKGGQPGIPGSSASGASGASGSPHAPGSLGSPRAPGSPAAPGSLGSPHAPGSLGAPQPPSPPATPKEPHATQ